MRRVQCLNSGTKSISRREFVVNGGKFALSLSAMASLQAALVGCGGGGGEAEQKINGTVDLAEVGGSGLALRSMTGSATVQSEGKVTVIAPREGARLALLHDVNNQARALCLLQPASNIPEGFVVDAASTALSLVFLTPGIATTVTGEVATRSEALRRLDAFGRLVDLLRREMPRTTLEGILGTEEYEDALTTCVSDYIALPEGLRSRGIDPDAGMAFCEVKVLNQGNARSVDLALENSAWRYASVTRRDVSSSDLLIDRKDFGSIGGGIALSLGSIFTNSHGEPTVTMDSGVNFTRHYRSEYWLQGPGWASAGAGTLPGDISEDGIRAWGYSIIMYLAFPVIDLITGLLKSVGEVGEFVSDLWDAISTSVSLVELIRASTWKEAVAALIDAVGSVLSYLAGSEILVVKGILSGAANALLGFILSIAGIGMATGNMIVAGYNWWLIPGISRVDVLGTGNGGVIVR